MTNKFQEEQTNVLISIVIPFHNREEFLAEAIESVVAQGETNWELLLVDDGSTDRSVELVGTFKKQYPNKIHLLSHPKKENRGASASRNLGVARAKGEFITFLDSDDVFFNDTLQKEIRAFINHPEADVVCGTLECWYSWAAEAGRWEKDFTIDLVLETEKLYQPPDLLVHNLNAGGRKPGIDSVMLKKDFAKQLDLFEDDYRYAWEDQVFWAKVSLNGKIYVMDAVLAKYRQHPASTCAVESESGRDISSMEIFLDWLEAYLVKLGIEDKAVWQALRGFQRMQYLETKLKTLKRVYRRMFPLHVRYKMRDTLTKSKQILSRSAHWHQ